MEEIFPIGNTKKNRNFLLYVDDSLFRKTEIRGKIVNHIKTIKKA